jgi:hypothetical protein
MGLANLAAARSGTTIVPRADAPPTHLIYPREDSIKEGGLVVLDVTAKSVGARIRHLNQARQSAVYEQRSFH